MSLRSGRRRSAETTLRARILYAAAAAVSVVAVFGLSPGHAAVGGTALQLNGTSQYATLGGSSDLRSATFTVELWFQRTGAGTPTSTGNGGITNAIPLITKGRAEAETAAADVNYFLGIDATSGKLVADFEEGQSGATPSANHPITGTTAIPVGPAWHHAAATYDGSTWNLYLDGALDATLAVGKPANAATTSLTAVGSALTTAGTAAGFFAGVVDEVRIWSTARTLGQIQAAKDSEITTAQTGLLGVWNLDEGSGSSLTDHSGNGKTGAAVASPTWVSGFVPPSSGGGAPNAPTVNAPGNGATGVALSPTLNVGVADPDSDPMTVTYFGRPLASGNFTQIAQHTGVTSGSNDTASWSGLGAGQTFEWYVTASDGTNTTTGPTWTFHTVASTDPVFVGVGDIASCTNTNDSDTAAVVQGVDGNVFTLGDNAYPSGLASDFTSCYDPTWGIPSIKSRTRPIPGNHDWGNTGTASDNLNGYNGYFGAAATDANGKSYYSYNIPSSNWHIVNLDSECEDVPGGCAAGSPQELWLKADLAANSSKNVIALWHKPRFSSGGTNQTELQPFVDDLYAAGADLVLVGHDHEYERIAPLDASGTPDPTHGIRFFTVGTGGDSHQGFGSPIAGSEVREGNTYGILKLSLHPTSYDWKFLPVAGSTFTDSGTGNVHDAPSAPVTTYYVDKTNGSCSDAGSGTQAQPFCTIGKGASVATAGQEVHVVAGTYAETVNPPSSGTAGNPITFSAASGVTVTGNGTSTGNAFRISSKSYITVDGFTVNGTVDYGIYVASSNHITISNNHVTTAGSPVSGAVRAGIYLNATTDSTVSGNTSDHNSQDGIRLTSGCTGVTVRDNVAFANAEQWERNATGIQVNGSSANTIIHNTTYANEDSGLQFYVNAHDNLVIDNLTYGNGDHGIDNNNSPNNVIVGNSVQGNHTAGINLEGSAAPGSGGATLANNIAVDNGIAPITGQKSNIRVDAVSQTGTTLDYDLVDQTAANGGTVEMIWGATSYTSLAAFKTAAPGQETHGLQADPLWVNAVAPAGRPPTVTVGDYHLTAGSPAIDSANSNASNEPSLDLDGHARVDDPATTDTGVGTRTYDDRGALEFVPTSANHAPVAVADSYSTAQDTTLTVAAPGVLGNDTDADSDSLTAVKVTDPAHGTLTLGSSGSINYVPTAGYNGPDSFTYKANDGTTNSNTVTVSLTVTAPPANTALQLNGSSQYATLGASTDLRSPTFTVELWFKRTGAGVGTSTGTGGLANAIPLISKGRAEAETAAADINYFLGIDATSGKLVADFEEGQSGSTPSANHPITGTTAIAADGTWHHAAATYDGSTWNLYLDGALDGTLAVNKPANAATTSLTAVGSALTTAGVSAGFFAGVVDEVRIWSSARTLTQIQSAKNDEITTPQTGLLGVWNLDDGSGSSLADHSGNGKTGAAVASPSWVPGFVPPTTGGPPAAPTVNAPANAATGVGLSPTLDVGVSDPDADPLTVTYFGRPLASGNFTQIAQHTNVVSGGNDTATWPGLGAGQSFEWYVTVNDGTTTTTGPTWAFHTVASTDPVFVGVGDIASCAVTEDTATGNIIKGIDGTIFTVGDNVYPSGLASDFTNCYAPTPWGDPSVKSRTRPAPGNHDWGDTGTASDNLNGYFGYYGSAATDANGKSYYSYDIASSNWHIVVLDSECEDVPGGCAAGSPQELWLKADLAANSGKNVIAIWHKPRYSSGATQYQAVQPLWDDLYAAGADILLDGHDHVYERTAPEKSGATLSSPPVADPTYGIRQFTVGMGGEGHHGLVTPLPTSEVRDDMTFGVLKLTLHASSYDWSFLPIDGSTFTDSGTGTVHGAPPAPGVNVLHGGDALNSGQSLTSPSGRFRLTMQSDGNLVEYDRGIVVWSSGTNPGGARAVMQTDGNFVVYNASSSPLWASDTNGNAGAYLALGDGGDLVVHASGGAALWAPGRLIGNALASGQTLRSPNGRFRLTMQGDGNLVEYHDANVVWASGTNPAGDRAVMQADGNFVVYNSSGSAVWATDTSGHAGAYLSLADSGELSVVSSAGAHLWAGPGGLASTTTLASGQALRSPSGAYRLTMQAGGDLVEQNNANTVIWSAGTSTGARVTMQDDGNLVVYDGTNHALWASNTNGHPGASLSLLDTGQLVIEGASGGPLWAASGALLPGAGLASGQTLDSPSGAYQLTMQSGGNLVVQQGATVVWSSGTSTPGSHAVMQGDGNLVVYSSASAPLWSSGSDGNSGAYAVLGDDGTLAVLSADGRTLWVSG